MKVLRDRIWSEQEAWRLIPCDARLLEGDDLKVDQSTLTGESLPITKGPGEVVFSGSTCKQGEMVAVVIANGVHTFFHKASHLVDNTNQVDWTFPESCNQNWKLLHMFHIHWFLG